MVSAIWHGRQSLPEKLFGAHKLTEGLAGLPEIGRQRGPHFKRSVRGEAECPFEIPLSITIMPTSHPGPSQRVVDGCQLGIGRARCLGFFRRRLEALESDGGLSFGESAFAGSVFFNPTGPGRGGHNDQNKHFSHESSMRWNSLNYLRCLGRALNGQPILVGRKGTQQ